MSKINDMSEEVNLNFELGQMVGEYIVTRFLPTLTTDSLQSRTVLPVPLELEREWNKKRDAWLKVAWDYSIEEKKRNADSNKIFYENLAWYKENIESVYLPAVLECNIPKFRHTNQDDLVKGIKRALWDCDMSHYDVEGIEIENGEGWWCTKINLKYSK